MNIPNSISTNLSFRNELKKRKVCDEQREKDEGGIFTNILYSLRRYFYFYGKINKRKRTIYLFSFVFLLFFTAVLFRFQINFDNEINVQMKKKTKGHDYPFSIVRYWLSVSFD